MDCRHVIQKPRSKVKSWQRYGFAVWHTIPILFLYMLSLLHVLYCIYFYCTSSKLVCISTFGYLFSTSVNMNVHVVIFLISTSATLSFLLVPRTCSQQQQRSLMGWHITLIVISVLALVVSLVIIITVIVVSCHQISELQICCIKTSFKNSL